MDDATRRPRGRPKAWDDKTEQNTIKSLDRALAVLQRLGESEGITLTDLARDMGQSTATLYRVLTTLEGRGFAEFESDSQAWHVGAGAFLAGAPFLRRTSLVERARPIMRGLMEYTGETANLGIAQGDHVMFVSQVETHASIRAFFPPGTLSPMHASGIGKALLSAWDKTRLEQYLARSERERFTNRTLVDARLLSADLSMVRKRGFAIDEEEKATGMRCIAAPVFNAFGEAVAGLSVSGPVARMNEATTPKIGAAVREASQSLSEALGRPVGAHLA
ncbi:HTH-type transcriptional regulator BhcR [Primorskyibacter sp. S187A]|uniref:HTH-type transcriptional regulator BhcR n=1 Tax=Primorskyibacter sp. S187A TaxID=3415130 RepID=UPI003C7A7A1C